MPVHRIASADIAVLPIFLLSLAVALAYAPAARAGVFPPGDYLRSCTDIAVDGTTLSAVCEDFNQEQAARTALPDFGRCVGNIGNVDGVLRCIGNSGPIPRGSYLETCTDTKMDAGNTLFSRCRNMNGDWVGTQLQMSGCMEPVNNTDGHLACTRTDLHGSFSETCWNIRTEGQSVLATCRTNAGVQLETRLNDISQCRGNAAGQRQLFNTDGHLGCAILFAGGNNTAPPGSQPPSAQCQPGNPHGIPGCGPAFKPPASPRPGPRVFTPQTLKPAIRKAEALQPVEQATPL